MRHGAAPDPDHSGGRRRRAAASPSRHPPGRTQPGRRHRPHRRGHGRPVPQDLAGPVRRVRRPAAMFGDRGTFSWSIGPLISWTIPNTGAAQAHRPGRGRHQGRRRPLRRRRAQRTARNGKRADRLCAPARPRKRAASRARAERPGRQPGAPVVPIWQDRLPDGAGRRTHAGRQRKRAGGGRAELSSDQIAVFLALGGGWEDGANPTAGIESAVDAGRCYDRPVSPDPATRWRLIASVPTPWPSCRAPLFPAPAARLHCAAERLLRHAQTGRRRNASQARAAACCATAPSKPRSN